MTPPLIFPAKLLLPRPVDDMFKISSPLGPRVIGGKPEFHKGIDFAVPVGTPIHAISDGFCFRAGWENDLDHAQGFGLRIWQEFDYGKDKMFAWYGHMSQLVVGENDTVKQGELLGFSGKSGRATGPHLHVQFRKKDSEMLYDAEWIT